MGWFEIVLLILVGIFALAWLGLKALIFVTHLLEKRPICSFVLDDGSEPGERSPDQGSPSASPSDSPISTSARQMNRRAEGLGFASEGPYRQSQGGIYRARCRIWTPPGRDLLALVGWGTTAGIAVDKTTLYTPMSDGGVIVTTDKPTGNDAYWMTDEAIVPAATFERLVEVHRRRLHAAVHRDGRTFPPVAGETSYRAMRELMAATAVERGEAVYLEPDRDAVRSTWKGAWRAIRRSNRVPEVVRT